MVMNEVNAALLKMFASNAIDKTEAPAGEGETPEAVNMSLDYNQVLSAVDEEVESGSEVCCQGSPIQSKCFEAEY